MKQMIISKTFEIRPEKGSDDIKSWTLELTIPEGTTERELAYAVMASEIVKVQNANRPKFYKIPNHHKFKKIFAKPGSQVDPEAETLERAKADPTYAAELRAKLAQLLIDETSVDDDETEDEDE